jgi:hypothetical protein
MEHERGAFKVNYEMARGAGRKSPDSRSFCVDGRTPLRAVARLPQI